MSLYWEILAAFLTGVGSVVGAGFAVKAIVKHERKQCDLRLDAFKEGLDRGKDER